MAKKTKKDIALPPLCYRSRVQPRLQEITEWVKQGATLKAIAEALHISYGTFINYRAKFPELEQALFSGVKDDVPYVDYACFKLATGQFVKTKTECKYEYQDTGGGCLEKVLVEEKTTEETIAPNPAAIRLFYERHGLLGSEMNVNNLVLGGTFSPELERAANGPPPLEIITFEDEDYIDVEFTAEGAIDDDESTS